MKIMITDDEIQIRKGLRMKVEWEEEGFHIVAEASNGQEALDILKRSEIDIVITDVRMPIMDGMEFVKRCHIEHSNVKVIVLSGYSDYEYVRSSMIEGVKDYLLKPVAPDELVDVLKRVRTEIEVEKKNQIESDRMSQLVHSQLEEMREQYLLHLVKEEWSELNMAIERLHQLRLEDFTNKNIQVQFLTVEIRGSDAYPNQLKELWLPFRMMCREISKRHEGTYTFYDTSYANMMHFIIHSVDSEQFIPSTYLVKDVQRYVKEFMGLETVIGIGNVVTGLTEFKNGYISALLSWSQSQLGSHSQVIEGTVNKAMHNFSPDSEKKLINSIENVNYKAFKNNMDLILGEKNNQSIMTFSIVANRVLFLLGSLARKYDTDTVGINKAIWNCQQKIWELNSHNRVIDQLNHLANSIIRKVNESRCSSNGSVIVENVRRYLDKHYANEISLTALSEQFHINSAYLSEMFKNHIGQNFSDYLINLRMNNAQALLKDRQLKIIDVAYLVGFSNSGYFSTVFKKYYGQTPVEFRKSLNMDQ